MDPEGFSELDEEWLWQWFGESICHYTIGRCPLNVQLFTLYLFVLLSLLNWNVLGARVMGLRVLREGNSTNVIAEDHCRLGLTFTELFQ